MGKLYLGFMFLFLCQHPLFSTDDIFFGKLNSQNGLSSNNISAIIQDKEGFIWIGTSNGLNRYDGYTIKNYEFNEPGTQDNGYNYIAKLLLGPENNLWVVTRGKGLWRYEAVLDRFVSYLPDKKNPFSIRNSSITDIAVINNQLVIASEQGIDTYNFQQDQFNKGLTMFKTPDLLEGENCKFLEYNPQNHTLWVAIRGKSLYKIDLSNQIYSTFSIKSEYNNSLEGYPTDILVDTGGKVWITFFDKGLYYLNDTLNKFVPFEPTTGLQKLQGKDFWTVIKGKNNELWLGSFDQGICHINLSSSLVSEYQYSINNPLGLNSNQNPTLFIDDNDILWVGNQLSGVNFYHPSLWKFKPNQIEDNHILNPPINNVKCFLKDGNTFYIGSYEGLYRYDFTTNEISTFPIAPFMGAPEGLSNHSVTSIIRDGNFLWVGTLNGLNRVNMTTSQIEKFYDFKTREIPKIPYNTVSPEIEITPQLTEKLKLFSDQEIWCLYKQNANTLWVGTRRGLNILNTETLATKHYLHIPTDPLSISHSAITTIVPGKDSTVWIGTKWGLNISRPNQNFFNYFLHDPADSTSLSNNSINCIAFTDEGNAWVGTENGLNFYDKNSNSFIRYYKKDGLPHNNINGIIILENGLWISCEAGLAFLNFATQKIRSFTTTDAMKVSFNSNAFYHSEGGYIYFGGTGGISSFYPDSIHFNKKVPQLVFTELRIFDKKVIPGNHSVLPKAINHTKKIVLEHWQSVISIEYAALNFIHAEKNQYHYKLEGIDNDWVNAGHRRTAYYSGLPPGYYNFRVKGANSDGIWNEEGITLTIEVLPPWWQSQFAYVGYIILVIIALYFFRKYTIIGNEKKNELIRKTLEREKIEEVNQAKLQFFTNVSHEFKTPLALILGYLDNLLSAQQKREVTDQLHNIQQNANRLLRLVNQLIDFRKTETGVAKLNIAEYNLKELIHTVCQSFEGLGERNKIVFQVIAPQNITLWLDYDMMEKVFYNLLSNAFKFTPTFGHISVEVIELDNEVEIKVVDSGIGISAETLPRIFDRYHLEKNGLNASGSGIGLALVKAYVELHKGRLEVNSAVGKGTVFSLFLNKGNGHFEKDDFLTNIPSNKNLNGFKTYPVVEKTSRNKAIVPQNNIMEATRKPMVLLVEDNSDFVNFLIRILSEHYTLKIAYDGLKGKEMALALLPDIIISDVMMPRMQGDDLCLYLKKEEKTKHIPIILLSALSDTENRVKGTHAGADDYIAKPFQPPYLKARIEMLLESRKNLKEAYIKEILLNPSEVKSGSTDYQFLKKAVAVIEHYISDPQFNVNVFAKEMATSRTLLYEKINHLTGKPVKGFVRMIRLKRAAQLLRQGNLTIAEIRAQVGIHKQAYFARIFREAYEMSPAEYKKLHNKNVKD